MTPKTFNKISTSMVLFFPKTQEVNFESKNTALDKIFSQASSKSSLLFEKDHTNLDQRLKVQNHNLFSSKNPNQPKQIWCMKFVIEFLRPRCIMSICILGSMVRRCRSVCMMYWWRWCKVSMRWGGMVSRRGLWLRLRCRRWLCLCLRLLRLSEKRVLRINVSVFFRNGGKSILVIFLIVCNLFDSHASFQFKKGRERWRIL